MSELTPELNLITAEDDDDTADYLTLNLRDSLRTLDGMFSTATGHRHNGAHQGGALQFTDLLVGGNLTVNGATVLKQTTTVQGALNAQAGATVTGNLSTGTLGSTGLATLQSLDVITTSRQRGAATFDSTIGVAGLATLGAINTGGITGTALQINGNGTVTGAFAAGSVTSGGSPVWTAATAPVSVPAAANTLVMRNSSGYIQASYINMTADTQAGKPTHVVGQNGDGFMRYWPISAIGPPALRSYAFTMTIAIHNGNFQACSIAGAGAAGIVTNNGSSLSAVRAGYYSIYAEGGGYNNVGIKIFTEGVERAAGGTGTPNAPDFLADIGCSWVGFINAGGLITFQGKSSQATWGGNAIVTFVPETTYNG